MKLSRFLSTPIRLLALASCAAVLVLIAPLGPGAAAGPANLGFENGLGPWLPVPEPSEAIVVVGTEGPNQFPVYGEEGVGDVDPNRGNFMLRLYTPSLNSENSNRGVTGVFQVFTPETDELTISLRIFSFEPRGDDTVRIDVQDLAGNSLGEDVTFSDPDSGQPFSVPMVRGCAAECSGAPCELVIDVGKRRDFLDSGWRKVLISGLPTEPATPVRLVYEVEGGQNEALATWAVWDSVNLPPVAKFTFNPGGQPGTQSLEGDYMAFDGSESFDPDGDPLTFLWTATGSTIGTLTLEGPLAAFQFPEDDASIVVTLTVTDSEGATDSVSTGEIASDGTAIAPISIDNAGILLNAINVEALPDSQANLLCRFLDPGVDDTHTATLDVGGIVASTLQEENIPAYSSGFVTGVLNTVGLSPTDLAGTCTVNDDDGESNFDPFTVRILDPAVVGLDPDAEFPRFEPNDSSLLATPLSAGWTTVSKLETPADIDFFELRLSNGGVPPTGTEFNITVDMPTDYDAIVLSKPVEGASSTPFESAPFVSFPFVSFPFVSFPFVSFPFVSFPFVSFPVATSPFVSFPFVSFPFVSFPYEDSPFVSFPFTFDQFPLSEVGLAAPDGSNVAGSDLGLGELGSLDLGSLAADNLRVKAISAGFGQERALVEMGPDEQALFLVVVSHDLGFSDAPYSITLEASVPFDQVAFLGQNCDAEPLVSPAVGPEVIRPQASPKTLFVTQKPRFMATHDMSDAEWTTWLAAMEPLFAHDEVKGKFISVASGPFDAWDQKPCDIAPLRAAAAAVRTEVLNALEPSIEYVVIVGSMDVIPPELKPDQTTIGFEGLFATDLPARPESPIAAILRAGQTITDACMVDANPLQFFGGELCMEDLPIWRLVETPQEILFEASNFVARDGMLTLNSALVTGYEFFSDYATNAASALVAAGIATDVLNDTSEPGDEWTADELRNEWCAAPIHDLNAVNGHMSYNALLTSAGFNELLSSDSFDDGEVVRVDECADLGGTLTVSIGCHSGLSVPAAWMLSEFGDVSRDWVQQPGSWIGPWTFGIGHTEVSNRGTEGVLEVLVQEFAENPGISIGAALLNAKRSYLQNLTSIDVYDVKSLLGLGAFGLPQARLSPATATTSALESLASQFSSASAATTQYYGTL